jgi:hypothetical protein
MPHIPRSSPRLPVRALLPLAALALGAGALWLSHGCTVEDIRDTIEVIEDVPAPQGPSAAHRLTRRVGLGGNSSRVDRGEFTFIRIRVLAPAGADLFPFSRINLGVRTSSGRFELAEGANFTQGETERELDVRFTDNITPFLAEDDLTVEWDIYYRTGVPYPVTPIRLETVIGVSVDVRIL